MSRKLDQELVREFQKLGSIREEELLYLDTKYVTYSFFINYDDVSSVTERISIEQKEKGITSADFYVLIVKQYQKDFVYITSTARLVEFIKTVPASRVKKEIGEKKCIYIYEKQKLLSQAFLSLSDWSKSMDLRLKELTKSVSRLTPEVDIIITKEVNK